MDGASWLRTPVPSRALMRPKKKQENLTAMDERESHLYILTVTPGRFTRVLMIDGVTYQEDWINPKSVFNSKRILGAFENEDISEELWEALQSHDPTEIMLRLEEIKG